MDTNLQDYSHKRFNILTGEWVLVSPHRTKRPWQGHEEEVSANLRPTHDPNCYLCSGNTRANGDRNPDYEDVFIFENDFAALQSSSPEFNVNEGLLKAQSETGVCKVICFSPDHSLSLAEMKVDAIEKVVAAWMKEYQTLGSQEAINYIQIFENKGSIMGCSNPHPHGQIWGQISLPNEVCKKDLQQKKYYEEHQSSLLGDYLSQELALQERIIFENDSFVILVPFWAVWPFETMIVPKEQMKDISELDAKSSKDFAEAISVITKAYDQIYKTSFPYSSGIHQAPTNTHDHSHWHWHMSFYPPLLRSATVKKFMVGYELFGTPQRDISPEKAVEMIKSKISK